jgi:MFS family permease
MWNFIRLELRKNRLLPLGLIGFSGFALLLSLGLAAYDHSPILSLVPVIMGFWQAVGMPIAALLFGTSFGSGLRGAAAPADAPLPVSPGRKVAASLIAAALGWLTVAGFVAMLLLAFSGSLFVQTDKFEMKDAREMVVAVAIYLVISLALLVYGFIIAYAVRNGIVGGMAALGLTGAIGAMLLAQVFIAAAAPHRAALAGRITLITLVAFFGALGALRLLAPWGERSIRIHAWRAGLILFGLIAGSLCGTVITRHDVQNLYHALDLDADDADLRNPLSGLRSPEAVVRTATGALFDSRKGDLLWLTPDGKRRLLIPADPPGLTRMLNFDRPFEFSLLAFCWDDHGILWIARKAWDTAGKVKYELWQGTPDAPLTLHTSFPEGDFNPSGLRMQNGELMLTGWNSSKGSCIAPLPNAGKMPQWKEQHWEPGEYWETNLQPLYERSVIARLSPDGKILEYRNADRVTACVLPGEAVFHHDEAFSPRTPSDIGSEKIYAVQIKTPEGSATAVCHDDGRVETVWPGKHGKRHPGYFLSRGDVWLTERPLTLFLLSADGRFLPPVNLQALWPDAPANLQDTDLPGIQLIRIEGSIAWLTLGGKTLVKLDGATGVVVQQWPLPQFGPLERQETYYNKVTDSGFFHATRERIYFVAWDGAIRDLGPAMAD